MSVREVGGILLDPNSWGSSMRNRPNHSPSLPSDRVLRTSADGPALKKSRGARFVSHRLFAAAYFTCVLANGSLNENTAPRWRFSAQMSPP